jgi:hypothetical protein
MCKITPSIPILFDIKGAFNNSEVASRRCSQSKLPPYPFVRHIRFCQDETLTGNYSITHSNAIHTLWIMCNPFAKSMLVSRSVYEKPKPPRETSCKPPSNRPLGPAYGGIAKCLHFGSPQPPIVPPTETRYLNIT